MTERISLEEYRKLTAPDPAPKRDIKPPKKAPKRRLSIKGERKSRERPTFLAAIMRLMDCKYPRRLRLKKEEQLAIAFATALREASIAGQLRSVWTHPANEIAGRRDKLAQIRYTIAKAMGLIDGTADYLFLWATGSGALEAKVGKNGQQANQIDFEVWCTEMGVPYRTFTSVDQGLAILIEWGVLTPQRDASNLDNHALRNAA